MARDRERYYCLSEPPGVEGCLQHRLQDAVDSLSPTPII